MSRELALQQILLDAAFAPGDQALSAWHKWERDSDWQEHVNFDSYLLLPQVYRNLEGASVDDKLFSRLKGIVRRNWVNNTAYLALLKAVATVNPLQRGGLRLLPPLTLLSQDRSSAFAGEAVSLWLPQPGDLRTLANRLRHSGWHTASRHVPAWCLRGYSAAARSLEWQHPEHGALRLLWPAPGHPRPWEPGDGTMQVSLGGSDWLCPTTRDTVRYLLLAPGPGSTFRRYARAMLVLHQSGDLDGWRCLLHHASASSSPLHSTVLALAPLDARSSAGDISNESGTPRPALPATGRAPFLRKQVMHWTRYRSDLGEDCGALSAISALPGYLMGKWELERLTQIPARLARGLVSDFRYRSPE